MPGWWIFSPTSPFGLLFLVISILFSLSVLLKCVVVMKCTRRHASTCHDQRHLSYLHSVANTCLPRLKQSNFMFMFYTMTNSPDTPGTPESHYQNILCARTSPHMSTLNCASVSKCYIFL